MNERRYVHYLRELFALVLLLFKLFIPASKSKILSIYFHNPSPKLFERIINYLIDNNYTIISLKQFNDIIDNKQLNEKIAVITIDDGWQNNLQLLEIVRKYKVFITIFVTTSAIEQGNFWWEYVGIGKNQNKASIKREIIRIKKLNAKAFYFEISNLKSDITIDRSVLTREELIKLSKNPFVTIGSHTVSHISLSNKSFEVKKNELLDSKNTLEMWTGQRIIYFSYPFGDYTEELNKLAKECGYKLCFTCETSNLYSNRIDRYSIPRRCVNDNAGFFEALSKIHGIWYKIKELPWVHTN
jgi:peptidoglycan/xylan/chitin deacetylase (PgdA/CDA1 family)